jgi:hypothetical protein
MPKTVLLWDAFAGVADLRDAQGRRPPLPAILRRQWRRFFPGREVWIPLRSLYAIAPFPKDRPANDSDRFRGRLASPARHA